MESLGFELVVFEILIEPWAEKRGAMPASIKPYACCVRVNLSHRRTTEGTDAVREMKGGA
jgi:hypothetical protein